MRGGWRRGTLFSLRPLGMLLVAALFGFVLAAAPGLFAASGGSVAWACGSGNPVMQANGLLATLDPATFNSGTDLPDTGGIFNLDYVSGKPISFGESLDYIGAIGAPPPPDLKLRWKFGDGSSPTETAAPSHTYTKPGTYLVYVEYFDTTSNSWQFFDYAHIRVGSAALPANAPLAQATASATSVEIGSNVTLDASGSKSQDGSPLTYTWDFNDGTRATGVKTTHQYVQPGKTLVELIVADGRGVKAVATLNLVIVPTNGLPTAAMLPSATSIVPGGTVSFDASQSHAPTILPNDQLLKFVWNFGDGTPAQTTTNPTVSHTFKQAGTYTVTLQAYDEQGAAGTTTVSIRVGTGGGSSGAAARGAGGVNWPLIGFGGVALAALAIGGYFALQAQRRRSALILQRQRAMELARARRVTQQRPVPPGQSGSARLQRPPGSSRRKR